MFKKGPVSMLLKKEYRYLFWFPITIFFGLFNVFAGFFLKTENVLVTCIQDGQFYTFSISLCIPLCFSLLMSFITQKKKKLEMNFVSRKIICVSLCFIWSLILALLWVGGYKNSILLQVLTTITSLLFCFYMYCISEMENFKDIKDKFDDKPYLDVENELLEDKKNKANVMETDDKGNLL